MTKKEKIIRYDIEARLKYALPWYESEDKNKCFYLVEFEDLERAIESLTQLFLSYLKK